MGQNNWTPLILSWRITLNTSDHAHYSFVTSPPWFLPNSAQVHVSCSKPSPPLLIIRIFKCQQRLGGKGPETHLFSFHFSEGCVGGRLHDTNVKSLFIFFVRESNLATREKNQKIVKTCLWKTAFASENVAQFTPMKIKIVHIKKI